MMVLNLMFSFFWCVSQLVVNLRLKTLSVCLAPIVFLSGLIVAKISSIPVKTSSFITVENQHECLLKRITPYFNVPYNTELELKQKQAGKIINTIKEKLLKLGTETSDFPIGSIIPSPITKQYRNKDDFSIRHGADGSLATVGYLVGSGDNWLTVRPTHLPHVKDAHKRMALLFEEYLRQSPHKVCYHFLDGGFWKRFTVRSNEAGDLMAIVITHPYRLSPLEMADERANLTNYFLRHEPSIILYHQECAKVDCSSNVSSYVQLAGKNPHLIEEIGNLKFQISPHSFFQINKKAAERMVNNIWSDMDVTNQTTFLDLYCGVGLFSLIGSHKIRNAVGIELLEGAVSNANKNAEINNITNCKFISGRVEADLSKVLKSSISQYDKLMPVLNPGRAGTTKKVIAALRDDNRIKKLIYVSCKPDNPHTSNNFLQLCRKGGHIKGSPFYITRIQLFDLFPRTAHYEMVLWFNRIT